MNGDFTRFTFDPNKQYVQTLMQQGRVQLDADWNGQLAIGRYHQETTTSAIIGHSGVPRIGGGFQIGLKGDASDLTISPGQMFLDGLLLENRAAQPVMLSDQPYLKLRSGTLAGFDFPTVSGRYLVYVEVWERHVTSLQDPELLETALGGADTTTRSQLVWQVKLSANPVAADARCDQFGPSWIPPQEVVTGTLTANTDPSQVVSNPCVLPPSAGYRGLENQLYRVEVHQGGTRDVATFKWSAYNGSIATTVEVSGQVLTARDLGRDEVLGFSEGNWIEILDERSELATRRGTLLRIEQVTPELNEIRIATSTPVPVLDTSRPVVIRRWDNPPSANAIGMAMSAAAAINLEAGIQVTFSTGTYREGDFWMIPARTALDASGGHIEWPSQSGVPQSVAPHGIHRFFSPLALVDFDAVARTFTLIADCRVPFSTLTDLSADDVQFCTVVVQPSSNIQAEVDRLTPGQGALFCFAAGDYTLSQPISVKAKGHLVFSGAGAATSLSAPNSESVFQFQQCASVQVRNLMARSGRSAPGPGVDVHLSGALTFLDCPSVLVDNVAVNCASGTEKSAACISVRNAVAESDALRAARTAAAIAEASEAERVAALAARTTVAQVSKCDLTMGDLQVGILLANVGLSRICDNVLRVGSQERTFTNRLTDAAFRARVRHLLISNLRVLTSATPPPNTNAQLSIQNMFVHFQTDVRLITNRTTNAWATLATQISFSGTPTAQRVRVYMRRLADQVLGFGRTVPNTVFVPFAGVLTAIPQSEITTATQGVVIGGRMADVVRITDNTIEGALEGIHIALGHRSPQGAQSDQAGEIYVNGNIIQINLGSTAVRSRFGVYVGSCRSLTISQNYMTVNRAAGVTIPIEGVRIFGNVGRRMVVRENHLQQFTTGFQLEPILVPADNIRRNLWIVNDNITETSPLPVAVSKQIVDAENQVGRPLIRRPDNYA